MTEFLTTAFKGKEVDLYCGGKDWFYGQVKSCTNGVVTLLTESDSVHINTDRILSVSPRS